MFFHTVLSLSSDPLKTEIISQRPEKKGGAHCPIQSQPGLLELQQIFPRRHNHLQEIMTSSNKCKHPKPKDGSCTLQNDQPQVRRKTDAMSSFQKSPVFQQICATSPLLVGLLKGNQPAIQHWAGSSTSSVMKADALVLKSKNPSERGHMSHKGTSVMVSSRCGPTRTEQDPSTTHPGHLLGADPSAYNYSAADVDRLPSNMRMYRTNAEILELINEKIASFRARRHKPDHNWSNFTTVPRHSTTFSSDKKNATMQSFSCSLTKRSTIVGQAFEVDRLKGTHANPKLTPTSDKNGNIPALKYSKGTKTSSVEVGPNKVIDKCITVGLETVTNNQGAASLDKENVSLNVVKFPQYEDISETEEPVQQHRKHKESQAIAISGAISHEHSESTTTSSLEISPNETFDKCITAGVDLPEQVNDGSKFVCSKDYDFQTLSSEKVNKQVTHIVNVNPVNHSLSSLKELVASLDRVVTNAEMDNVSEVLLQQYWNGDRENIHVFSATEYPQIMLEVAATCTRHEEEESPVVIAVLSPRSSLCSRLPQEDRTSLINVENKLPGTEPVCEVSSITKHTVAKDQGNTSLKPKDIGSVQSVTNVSVYPQQSKEGHSNVKESSSMHNIPSENVPRRDDNREEQLLSHSSSSSIGKTVPNNHEATSMDKKTFSTSVLKVPQYEDVSDTEDPVQQYGKHKESQFAAFCEDLNDDETLQTANTVVETPTHPSEGSRSEIKSRVPMDSTSDAKLIPEPPQNCCCPYYIETVTGFEHVLCPQCDGERLFRVQTNGLQSPSIVLKKKDEHDDEMDHRLVTPLKVEDVAVHGQVEPDDANHEGEQIGTPNPVPVSASPLLAMLDTKSTSTQVQTKQPGDCYHIPPPEGTLEMEIDIAHSSRDPSCESDDSCETEDSCDYMPTQGRNYLTVSRQVWKNLPAPSPSEHKDKRTRFHLNQEWRRQKSLTKRDEVPGSDSEDENDSGMKMTKERKQIPPHSKDIGASSFYLQKRHSSDKDSHCETVEKKSTPEQPSRNPQELSVKNLSEDITELLSGPETDDGFDDANYKNAKKSNASSSDSEGDGSIEEKRKLEEAIQRLERTPQHKSQVGQPIEEHGAFPETPQSKKTKQGLKSINAEVQTGSAQLKINREITSKGKHAASKAKTKDKTNKKARRAARIYSDSSEAEEGEDAFSDVSDSLHTNKHLNIGQMNEATDGTDHVQHKANLLMTSKRINSDDELEQDHVNKKAKTSQLSETEDSEDSFSDTPDSCTLQKQNKRLLSPKEPPDKHPQHADSTSLPLGRGIVNRLYVQGSPRSNERLKLSKQFPFQTHGADGQPHVTANTNASTAATIKKADSKWQTSHWNRDKEERFVPKSKSLNNSHPAVQVPNCKPSTSAHKQHSPSSQQQLSRSYSSPPTSGLPRPSSKNYSLPTSAHSSAVDKVKGIWKDQFYPIPLHKKASLGTEDNSKNDVNPTRQTDSGPSDPSRVHRRRHSSYKSETPLMKKTKSEAKERTRDINHNPQRQHGRAVADHYKWKNRRGRECEGSRRQRPRCPSSPELEWD